MGIKKEEIKIRLTLQEKELIKRVSKQENMTMSELILSCVIPLASKKEETFNNRDVIEGRIENMEGKIQSLRGNMEQKRGNNSFFHMFLKKNW